jgi:hypothetical protein
LELIGEVNLRAALRFLNNLDKARKPKEELRSAVTTLVIAYESYCKLAESCENGIRGFIDNIFPLYTDKKKNSLEKATELSLLIYVIYIALGEKKIAANYLEEANELGERYFEVWREIVSRSRLYREMDDYPLPEDDLDDEEEMINIEEEKFQKLIKRSRIKLFFII